MAKPLSHSKMTCILTYVVVFVKLNTKNVRQTHKLVGWNKHACPTPWPDTARVFCSVLQHELMADILKLVSTKKSAVMHTSKPSAFLF